MACGKTNCPSPLPWLPNLARKVPHATVGIVAVTAGVLDGVAIALGEGVGVSAGTLSVGVPEDTGALVGVDSPGIVAVGVAGHPLSALFTPLINCEIVTVLSASANASQAVTGCAPSAMLTPRIRSAMSTVPFPLQSPTQRAGAAV